MTQATVRLQLAAADALSPGWERNLISVAAWRKRVGVEPFHVLQTKDLLLESTASPDEYLNFRTPIAHGLAHGSGFWAPRTHLAHASPTVTTRHEGDIVLGTVSQ